MFTINIYLRFALIAFGIIGGGIMSATLGFWYGFPFILMGLILFIGYVIMGTIFSAQQMVMTQDFEAAEKRLGLTLKPEWLYEPNQAAYFLLKGMLAVQRQDYEVGEKLMLKAVAYPALGDNEKASIYLQLASIHGNKQRWAVATNYMRKTKDYKVTEPQLKEQIAQTEKALAQRGQMRVGQAQMRVGGGKRRNPRVR